MSNNLVDVVQFKVLDGNHCNAAAKKTMFGKEWTCAMPRELRVSIPAVQEDCR